MRKAVEQETLQALVETGAAREFRVLHDGENWRLELRLGVKWLSTDAMTVLLQLLRQSSCPRRCP